MSKAPAYGEEPPLKGFRRSFTAPHRQLTLHERAGLDNSDADSGLLYQHPAVRIFSFAPPIESIVSKSSERLTDADYPIDTVETLPWRSRTEDLIASGSMRIEKIKGSVHFLKCGSNFVYSILRNSQCWCVDGESKFVLRKGRFQYYRIELPNAAEGDRSKVEELKAALATILKFEKTPCPFKRAFHVDLPDDAITPRRKGKWTRRDDGALTSPDTDAPAPRKWRSSRPPTSYNGPPTAFPESFGKRRASDYVTDLRTPARPVPLERRRSVAERRAAFENLQSPSQPSSRPRTPASVVSSDDMSHEDYDDSENEAIPKRNDSRERPSSTERRSPLTELPHQRRQSAAARFSPLPTDRMPMPVSAERHFVVDREVSKATDASPMPINLEPNTNTAKAEQAVPPRDESQPEIAEDFPPAVHDAAHDLPNPLIAPAEPPAPESLRVNMAKAISDGLLSQSMTPPIASPSREPTVDSTGPEQYISHREPESEPEVEARSAHFLDIPSPGLRPMGSVDTLYSRLLREVSTEAAPTLDQSSEIADDTESVISTADSFHTVDTINEETIIDTDPTPMAELFDPLGAKRYPHKRDVSEVTVTASTFSGSQPDGERPGTPKLVQSTASDDSWPDVGTPSNDIQDGLRQRIRSRRSLSPLPPSDTVVRSPPAQANSQLAAAIIQKAATLVVVKPIEVVALVVHVLARIAGGATLNDLLSGGLFQRPQESRRHARNPSFPDHIVRDDTDEDDFGVPIRGRVRSSESASTPAIAPIGQAGAKDKERDTDVDSLFADDLD